MWVNCWLDSYTNISMIVVVLLQIQVRQCG
uniref:Uncharacterized protein n=1 Tax=Rhizophora mucronata TaxID=61149 RepID=A0A2P2IJB0_RHIMU